MKESQHTLCEDPELASLANTWLRSHKALVLDAVMDISAMRKNMKENAADAIKDVETRHASALQQMQHVQAELQDDVLDREHEVLRAAKINFRLSHYICSLQNQKTVFWTSPHSVRKCFQQWGSQVIWNRGKKKRNRLTARHNIKRLQKMVITRWRTRMQILQTQQQKTLHQTQLSELKKQLVTQYEEQVNTLQTQLKESHHNYQSVRQHAMTLDDDLRRIFLRGVSVMNREALSLFQDRGISSIPITPSEASKVPPPDPSLP